MAETTNGEDVDPKHIHELVLQRLYHEDSLLAQRTYNFLTFNVVLAGLLVLSPSDKSAAVGFLTAVLGITVAVLQTAFGRRSGNAITFYREYGGMIERQADIPVDHLLFVFYS